MQRRRLPSASRLTWSSQSLLQVSRLQPTVRTAGAAWSRTHLMTEQLSLPSPIPCSWLKSVQFELFLHLSLRHLQGLLIGSQQLEDGSQLLLLHPDTKTNTHHLLPPQTRQFVPHPGKNKLLSSTVPSVIIIYATSYHHLPDILCCAEVQNKCPSNAVLCQLLGLYRYCSVYTIILLH